MKKDDLHRSIPGINSLIESEELSALFKKYDPNFIKYLIRTVVSDARKNINKLNAPVQNSDIVNRIIEKTTELTTPSLIPVINATGITLHTNLGRAPLGKSILEELSNLLSGYSNLEFDLKTAKRQNRNSHITELLKYLTGAEDALVVNNNAAAVMLLLNAFAKDREVIISRGELIEIGESFRIHEIMEASGAIVREVGTTNRTKLNDYQKAINDKTALIIKAHKSNYTINGFTEEVFIKDLAILSKKSNIPLVYDLGSGLITSQDFLPKNSNEPNAVSQILEGADIVTFSGDKLLGGPQCGIIIGKKELISKIKSTPMLRALRIGKLSYAALSFTLRQYLHPINNNSLPTMQILNQSEKDLKKKAETLSALLVKSGIKNKIVKSKAQCGGGTMPEFYIPSCALEIAMATRTPQTFLKNLLNTTHPVLGIVRSEKFLLDVFAIDKNEYSNLVESCRQASNH